MPTERWDCNDTYIYTQHFSRFSLAGDIGRDFLAISLAIVLQHVFVMYPRNWRMKVCALWETSAELFYI